MTDNIRTRISCRAASLALIARTLLLLLPLMLATPRKAFGYADPGTGAFIYQAAYAVFLGGSFYLRKLLDTIFQRRKQSVSLSSARSGKRP